VRGEAAVDVEHLATGDRMHGNDRMFTSRIATLGRGRPVAADIGHAAVVNGGEAFEERLHRGRQQLVGEVHVGIQRVATAHLGRLGDVQRRRERRDGIAGDVGVPCIAGGVGRILGGLDDQQFRIGLTRVVHRVDVEVAEVATECLVGLAVEVLIAEHEHAPLGERPVQISQLSFVERAGEIESVDLGAQMWCERRQLEAVVALGSAPVSGLGNGHDRSLSGLRRTSAQVPKHRLTRSSHSPRIALRSDREPLATGSCSVDPTDG
jgi:hypothetical protein